LYLSGSIGKEWLESYQTIGAELEAGMKRTAFQVHKFWMIRAALVFAVTVLADAVVVSFVQRPFFWSALIGSSLPFTMVTFVAFPVLREGKRKSEDPKLPAL
jgi:hypothetical protein